MPKITKSIRLDPKIYERMQERKEKTGQNFSVQIKLGMIEWLDKMEEEERILREYREKD